MKRISIIIPTYNSVKYLTETLDSVLAQSYTCWECIIVDDGSSDHTETIILNYLEKEERFQFYKRPEYLLKGPSACRNFGVTQASGDYFIFLDSDDLLASNCLENRIKEYNEHQDSDFLIFQMDRFLKQPDFSKRTLETEYDANRILKSFIHLHGQWAVTSPIYKASFFKRIGFNNNLVIFEDLELAIKAIILAKKFKIFETIDCYYRNDENYKTKYNSFEMKAKMIKGFQILLLSLTDIIKENTENKFKNTDIKTYLIESYKRIFCFNILESNKVFKKDNDEILNLLRSNFFLTKNEVVRFFVVKRVLLPFASIKGSGVSRLIKFIYN